MMNQSDAAFWAEAKKRGLANDDDDGQQYLTGVGKIPTADAYNLDDPLTERTALAAIGLRDGRTGHVDTGTLMGNVTQAKLDYVARSLLKEEIAYANSQPEMRLPTASHLRPSILEPVMIRKMSPFLPWEELVGNRKNAEKFDITIPKMKHSWFNDPLLDGGMEIGEDGIAPLVEATLPGRIDLHVGRVGLGMMFSERALQNNVAGFNEMNFGLTALNYALAFTINKKHVEELANEFDTTYRATLEEDNQVLRNVIPKAWNDPTSNPFTDVRQGALDMEEADEWFFDATHLAVNPKGFHDLMKYATNVDHTWTIDPTTGQRLLQIDDIQIVKLPPLNGMPDTAALLMSIPDGVEKPLDIYEMVNTGISRSGMFHIRQEKGNISGRTHIQIERNFVDHLPIAKRIMWLDGVR